VVLVVISRAVEEAVTVSDRVAVGEIPILATIAVEAVMVVANSSAAARATMVAALEDPCEATEVAISVAVELDNGANPTDGVAMIVIKDRVSEMVADSVGPTTIEVATIDSTTTRDSATRINGVLRCQMTMETAEWAIKAILGAMIGAGNNEVVDLRDAVVHRVEISDDNKTMTAMMDSADVLGELSRKIQVNRF
jgi:hypothetical protein